MALRHAKLAVALAIIFVASIVRCVASCSADMVQTPGPPPCHHHSGHSDHRTSKPICDDFVLSRAGQSSTAHFTLLETSLDARPNPASLGLIFQYRVDRSAVPLSASVVLPPLVLKA
jgi:hypothetical protein